MTDAPAADPRRFRRQRVLLRGKVVFNRAARSIDCVVRNLSEEGASIRFAADPFVPESFFLIEMRSGVVYAANVIWRKGDDYGLAFSARRDLNAPSADEEMKLMRRLWLHGVR